jgi:hypothetical protein
MQQRVPSGESDLPEAGAILRRAFAAQFGMPPDTFWTDRDFVTGRWMTDPSLAFGAWMGDRLVGSSLGTSWGSLGIFGLISTPPTPGITGLPSWDLFKHSTSFARAGWKARRSSRREAVGDALL